jgi:hypothetical protein
MLPVLLIIESLKWIFINWILYIALHIVIYLIIHWLLWEALTRYVSLFEAASSFILRPLGFASFLA